MNSLHHPILHLTATILLLSCSTTPSLPTEEELPLDRTLVQVGDLLFRRGESLASQVVILSDIGGEYSHVGMAVEVEGEIMAAHAAPSSKDTAYVKVESLDEFFKPSFAKRGAVCRFPIDSLTATQINTYALEVIAQQIPFDDSYNCESQDELYCTEYVWLVYKEVMQKDITNGERSFVRLGFINTDIILPSHLYNNPDLKPIILY